MRARTIFVILLVLILVFTFGPALIAVGSQFVAEAFGCQTDLNRAVPCVIGGKDYGQTFYDLGFLIWYSYLTLPIGAVLAAIWAVAAFIAFVAIRRRRGQPAILLGHGRHAAARSRASGPDGERPDQQPPTRQEPAHGFLLVTRRPVVPADSTGTGRPPLLRRHRTRRRSTRLTP